MDEIRDDSLAEARLHQADEHHDNVSSLLGAIIQQNDENNPTPTLESIVVQNEDSNKHLKGISEKLDNPIKTEIVGEQGKKINNAAEFISGFLQSIKGDKGDSPIKGKDYYTPLEIEEAKKEITPIKGKDYFTNEELGEIKKEIKKDVTPIKGIDYSDGKDAVVDYEKIKKSVIKEIPKPKDGIDGEDGKTPTIEDLKKIIKPLIPKEKTKTASADEVVETIKKLEGEKRIPIESIKGTEEFLRVDQARKFVGGGLTRGLDTVSHDSTMTGRGTENDPLKVVGIPTSGWSFNGDTLGDKKTLGSLDNYDIGFITNGIEKMTVSKEGNVGIGTTVPKSNLDVSGSFSIKVDVITTNTALDETHHTAIVSNGSTITIPTAVGVQGRRYNIIRSGTSNVLINTTSGQTISGDSSLTLTSQWDSVEVVSDNSNWVRCS